MRLSPSAALVCLMLAACTSGEAKQFVVTGSWDGAACEHRVNNGPLRRGHVTLHAQSADFATLDTTPRRGSIMVGCDHAAHVGTLLAIEMPERFNDRRYWIDHNTVTPIVFPHPDSVWVGMSGSQEAGSGSVWVGDSGSVQILKTDRTHTAGRFVLYLTARGHSF